jgi:hypothetical protein
LIFDNSATSLSARDVTAAYRHATAEVRVRFSPGAPFKAAVGRRPSSGENDNALLPASCPLPTAASSCGGARVGTGGRLLSAKTQVRFLPPQLEKVENLSRTRTSLFTEVIRPDEEPVLKTGGGLYAACGFESHGFRSRNKNRSTKTIAYTYGPVVQRPTTLGLHPSNEGSIPSGTTFWEMLTADC